MKHCSNNAFIFGLLIISLLFLIDDMNGFFPSLQVVVNFVALTILFAEFNLFKHFSTQHLLLLYFLFLHFMGTFHFMNGINGMTVFMHSLFSY